MLAGSLFPIRFAQVPKEGWEEGCPPYSLNALGFPFVMYEDVPRTVTYPKVLSGLL